MARAQRLVIPALAVLLAACVAAEAISTPTLGDLLRSRAGSAKVSTASVQEDSYGYDQYGIETKELCLQESEMKTCGWVNNCIDDDATAGAGQTAGGPPRCTIGQFWTSDFSCCQEASYGYDGPTGLRHSQLWSASANIGTCDWTVLYVDPRNLDYTLATGAVSGSTDITNNIAKLGTAWSTCYLGADSEACGGPLCDRMVMSMQGTVYLANNAYSHWSSSTTSTNTLCAAVSGPIDLNNPGTTTNPPGRLEASQNNPAAASVPKAGPVSTAAELQYSGHGHDNYGYDSNTRSVYRGPATIIMGIINGLAGQHKEKWDEGVFEYVPYFSPAVGANPITPPAAIDPSYPWVRDKTYKLTFYRGAKY